jgi:SAM-dependent methyltransferase
MDASYDAVTTRLRAAYNASVAARESYQLDAWRLAERAGFLELLQAEGARTLLEIGPGAGKDSLFFQERGLDVTCVDLSPELVEACRQKGLNAHVRDALHLGFEPAAFDAVYSMNCLLHVPRRDLPTALAEIQRVLKPGGVFYLGLWGGVDSEHVWDGDTYEPKRFFSFHTNDALRAAVQPYFTELAFVTLPVNPNAHHHFQRLHLRR